MPSQPLWLVPMSTLSQQVSMHELSRVDLDHLSTEPDLLPPHSSSALVFMNPANDVTHMAPKRITGVSHPLDSIGPLSLFSRSPEEPDMSDTYWACKRPAKEALDLPSEDQFNNHANFSQTAVKLEPSLFAEDEPMYHKLNTLGPCMQVPTISGASVHCQEPAPVPIKFEYSPGQLGSEFGPDACSMLEPFPEPPHRPPCGSHSGPDPYQEHSRGSQEVMKYGTPSFASHGDDVIEGCGYSGESNGPGATLHDLERVPSGLRGSYTEISVDTEMHHHQEQMNQAHINQAHIKQGHVNQGHVNQGHVNQGHVNQGHVNQGHVNQAHNNQAQISQAIKAEMFQATCNGDQANSSGDSNQANFKGEFHSILAASHRRGVQNTTGGVPAVAPSPSKPEKREKPRIKLHKCPVCLKNFKRPSSFRIHFTTHTGIKMFKCEWPECGKKFNVKSNMTRHHKLHLKRK